MKLKIFLVILHSFFCFRVKSINEKEIISKVVKVKSTPSISVYGDCIEKNGLGCIIDKKEGLVLITKNLANHLSICKYEITLCNGTKIEAKLKYFDPLLNWAVLEIDSKLLPKEYTETVFSKKTPLDDEKIFVTSFQNENILVIEGNIIDKNFIYEDTLPQNCCISKMKNKGNFTSAPVFNTKGELLSIVLKDNQDGILFFLDPSYIVEFISSKNFENNKSRKSIGVICSKYSLHDAIKYRNLSENFFKSYDQSFPENKGNILIVKSIIKGSPAENFLEIGDIIVSINGVQTGANLQLFDSLINFSEKNIKIEIIRDGILKTFEIKPYNSENYKVKKFIDFAGAIFFQSDEQYSYKRGICIGELTFYKCSSNSFQDYLGVSKEKNIFFYFRQSSI
jgi:S1-C subfamily serine protease